MPTVKGIGQLALFDQNDAIVAGTAPTNPVVNTLWLDNSTTPNALMRWTGSAWAKASVTTASDVGTYTSTVVDTKIGAVDTKAVNAQNTANTANGTANAVKGTVDGSKSSWDLAYSRAQKWKGTGTAGSENINGQYIDANTISALQIAIGDFTNLAQPNAESNYNPFNYTRVLVNGYYYFRQGTGAYSPMSILESPLVEFRLNSEYMVQLTGYKDSAVTSLNLIARYYYTDGTWSNAGSVAMPITTAVSTIKANLKITADPTAGKTVNLFKVFFEKDSGTTGYYYVRELGIFKRYTGELIVNGSITSDHINVATLSALSADIGTVTAGSITGVSYQSKQIETLDATGRKWYENVSISYGEVAFRATSILDRNTNGGYQGVQETTVDNSGVFIWTRDDNLNLASSASLTGTSIVFSGSTDLTTLAKHKITSTGSLQLLGDQEILLGVTSATGAVKLNTTFNANNRDIINVNMISFNDAGVNEGLQWLGGNDWRVYEAPDTLTNASGNLQFVVGGKKAMTIRNNGEVVLSWSADNSSQMVARANFIEVRGSAYTNVYASPNSGGEFRVTESGGNDTYLSTRADRYYSTNSTGKEIGYFGGSSIDITDTSGTYQNLYLRPTSAGEVRVTQAGTTATYKAIRASSFPTGSSINYKTNVKEMTAEESREIFDATEVFTYHLIGNIEAGIYDKPKVGMIAEMVHPKLRDEDGVDTYSILATLWRMVKAQDAQLKSMSNKLADLELALSV